MSIQAAIANANAVSAVAALAAGGLWIRSATVSAPAPQNVGMGAVLDGGIYDKDNAGAKIDVLETSRLQSRWNRRAAIAAACAAGFQAIAAGLGYFSGQ